MARDAFFHVKVVDENGQERVPGANDKVMIAGASVAHDTTGGFTHEIRGKGDLEVVVIYKGFAALRQSFEAEAQVDTPSLKPFWPGTDDDPDKAGARRNGYLLECLSLHAFGGGAGDKTSPLIFALTVKLFPTREYVAVVGADYWEGADEEHATGHHASLDFDRGALTFAGHLFLSGTLNSGSPMTVIDCQRGRGDTWMRIANAGRSPWRRQGSIDSSFVKKAAPKWATDKAFTDWLKKIDDDTENASDYLGATDVYAYLNGVGANRPGTVADFSIFSHSWQGGPILYDTNSQTQRAGHAERDSHDLDMRGSQDFVSPNKENWSDMPKAFASDAQSHVWGCFATTVFLHMVQHLLSGSKARFKETAQGINRPFALDLAPADVAKKLKEAIATSYMMKLSEFTKVPAFGGPPGFGADLTDYDAIATIPPRLRGKIGARKQAFVPRTWNPKSKFRKFYESADLGSNTFDVFGYLKHSH
jgi:hypothetical protein